MVAVDIFPASAEPATTPRPKNHASPSSVSFNESSLSQYPQQHENDESLYPGPEEPLLFSRSPPKSPRRARRNDYRSSSTSPPHPLFSFFARVVGWLWLSINICFNRITAWLFPNEPEPLDLHSTIFFVTQVPFLFFVALTWIPSFVVWLFGARTSQAGDSGKGQGMRKAWSIKLALALSFLKVYLRHAEHLTIEACQDRSRSIPFMTAPAGIRVSKVKIPAFPFRSRAEAIVYECLSDKERALLGRRKSNRTRASRSQEQEQQQEQEQGQGQYGGEHMSVRAGQETKTMAMEMTSIHDGHHQTGRTQERRSLHREEDQFAEGLDAEWLEYFGPEEIGSETHTNHQSGNIAAVLYLHGGGYYTGSKEEHRVLIGPLVKRLGKNIRILTVNYRLAPQHPFPAALVDALSCYMWLLDQPVSDTFPPEGDDFDRGRGGRSGCFQPNQILFMGDSAGGGLALSLSLLIRDHGSLPQPLSIVTWSPWLDLSQSLPSFKENALTDCIPYEDFTHLYSDAVDKMFEHLDVEEGQGSEELEARPRIRQRAQVYCPDSCLRMKYVSPLFETNFSGIPSVFITCGSAERFANECVLLAARLEEQQQLCRIDIHEDMPHIFPLFRFHPSASTALDRTSAYIREIVHGTDTYLISSMDGAADVIIPISSTSSSLSSSRASSPVLTSSKQQSDEGVPSNFNMLVTISDEGAAGAQDISKRPLGVRRTDSSSSVSSGISDRSNSTAASSSSAFSSGPLVPKAKQALLSSRLGKTDDKKLKSAFDPQVDALSAGVIDLSLIRIRTAVNVVDLTGSTVMSYHKRNRHGPCDPTLADRTDSSERRRQRRQQTLTLEDVVSDATLHEWEIMLKQGYTPTRIWPHPPSRAT